MQTEPAADLREGLFVALVKTTYVIFATQKRGLRHGMMTSILKRLLTD